MASRFELHVGFPTSAEAAAREFLAGLQRDRKTGWSCSDVLSVHSQIEAVDPHNVPGTLKYLISQSFSDREDVSADDVLLEAQEILSTLAKMDIQDARLEVEYVFGYRTHPENYAVSGRSLPFSAPPEWSAGKLNFQDGERIVTPNSEIHFVIEKKSHESLAEPMSSDQASHILTTYGVDVQQTIEYRSQAMTRRGSDATKLICTSYHDSPSQAEDEAERIFGQKGLFEELATRDLALKLVLERILGCFKPVPDLAMSLSSTKESGVEYASHIG
jgi:hypothetical protein